MYHKIRNTLAGLALSAAFLVGGLLLSEPLPAEAAPAQAASPMHDGRTAAIALARLALVQLEAEIAAESSELQSSATATASDDSAANPASPPARRRVQVSMPYYSFGALLPRRQES